MAMNSVLVEIEAETDIVAVLRFQNVLSSQTSPRFLMEKSYNYLTKDYRLSFYASKSLCIWLM